jgi:Uncharacterized protein conserved in bacteria (DUF2059)
VRYRLILIVLALGPGSAVPVLAQSGAVPVLASSTLAEAHRAACDDLAAIVVSNQQMELQIDKVAETTIDQLFASSSDMQNLEAAYPGMKDALGAGIKPVLRDVVFGILPQYRAELSALYQANLTTREARNAAAFFRSPPMVKMLDSAYASVDYKAAAVDALADKAVTAGALSKDYDAAGRKAALTLTAGEQAAVGMFMTSPLGLKLRAINPQKLAIETKWANYTDPQSEALVASAVTGAMISHIALSDPETADLMRQELAKPQN